MAVQDLNAQLGAELKEDFLNASAATTDKVIFQLFANGSIVLTKKGGTAPGASEDQIDISAGEKYTVNLTLADIEKLSPYTNLTYILYRWELLYQMPYDPVIFTGDITLVPRGGQTLVNAFKNPRNIYNMTGSDVETLEDLNALEFAWQTGDMVTIGTDKILYRYNGSAFELVNDNPTAPKLAGILKAVAEIDYYMYNELSQTRLLVDTDFSYCDLSGYALGVAVDIFKGANLTGVNLTAAVLTNANLTGADFTGADLTGATMPANADTKAEFKAVVGSGNWDAVTTIWTDGEPIGE